MVGTETTAIHRTASIYQPVATPHQAFLSTGSEVPLDKKSSFPRGKPRGTTILVVTHEKDLVQLFSKRVIVIDEGVIVSDGEGYYDED